MKNRIVLCLAASMAAICAQADTEKVGDYTWTYRINGETAEIFNDEMGGSTAISPKPTGAVTIPSTLGGKPVTSIGSSAFFSCSGLTSVTIPAGVTKIGTSAFWGCSGLTGKLTIPDSVTDIGIGAFGSSPISGCNGLDAFEVAPGNPSYKAVSGLLLTIDGTKLVAVPGGLTGVLTIPDSVTYIGEGASEGCTGLTGVKFPDGVTYIGAGSFYSCSGLTSVTIPDSVTIIAGDSYSSGAFAFCSGLTSVTIGNGVTSIGRSAFAGCDGLTGTLTIPDSVTSIGVYAFSGCAGLTSVAIGNGVTAIAPDAFSSCNGLESFDVAPLNPSYKADSGLLLTIDGKMLVAVPSGLKGAVSIPAGVTSIGFDAFFGCSGLTSVTIPDSVTSIGGHAFSGCSGLTSVTIPDSVTSIGDYAFGSCTGLTNVMIGNGVTSIGGYAFGECGELNSISVASGNAN